MVQQDDYKLDFWSVIFQVLKQTSWTDYSQEKPVKQICVPWNVSS